MLENEGGDNAMTFVPTLNFNGKCREAMEMYQRAFSGEVTALLTYGQPSTAPHVWFR